MLRPLALPSIVALAVSALACAQGTETNRDGETTGGQGASGGSGGSGGTGGGIGGGPSSTETCGNGLDDDGNGVIDDGCACDPGQQQKCYVGAAAQAGKGACTWGTQTCVMDGSEITTGKWGDCTGSGGPSAEACGNAIDDDCDGEVDEGCDCAPPVVTVGGLDVPLACGAATAQATLTFDKGVTGVVADDTVTATGGATITGIAGGPTVYTVSIASLAQGGSYTLNVAPVGPGSHIESVDCKAALAAPVTASFAEGSSNVSLAISPGPVFSYGGVLLNTTVEHTFTVTPSGGVASNVAPSIPAPFGFKGGAYPGAGGTCGANIAAPCTVIVTYSPSNTCADFATLSLGYDACAGTGTSSIYLSGYGKTAGAPTTCQTSNTLYVSPAGSDNNTGLAPNAPKLTIGAALAISIDGSEIHVAEGTYPEALNVSGCRKLFGGYDASFAAHDPKVHVTSLVASVDGGGVISFPGASLHLDGFTVHNTAATGEALYYFQGGSVISNNVLTGADYGMYFWQHSCGSIHDNVLSGAQGGLYFWQSRIPVYNNKSTGTNAAVTTWQNQGLVFSNNDLQGGSSGIQTWQQQGMVFDGNRISGTNNGVDGWQSSGVVYRNNYLHGPSTAITESSDSVTIANNTIVGPSTLLNIGAQDYVVVNNVFLGTGGGATGVSGAMPSSIENNLFFGLGTFAAISGKPPIVTAAGVDALDGTPLANMPPGCTVNVDCWHARAAGNVTTALLPGAVFMSVNGVDGVLATLGDDDWHLATNDPAITQGGRDASQGDCGSHESPRSCGGVAADIAGLARSVPYSIGAHEK